MLIKIISGGQTGADIGALRAACELGLQTGGYAPRDFRTENGYNPALSTMFGLQEHSSSRYPERTQSNILAADGTLVFGTLGSPGSMLTQHYATRYSKPLYTFRWPNLIADLPQLADAKFVSWINDNRIRVLNVAGNRESQNPGIQHAIRYYLIASLAPLLRAPAPAAIQTPIT